MGIDEEGKCGAALYLWPCFLLYNSIDGASTRDNRKEICVIENSE